MSSLRVSRWLRSPLLWLGLALLAAFLVFRAGSGAPAMDGALDDGVGPKGGDVVAARDDRSERPGEARPPGTMTPRTGLSSSDLRDLETATVVIAAGGREIRGWVRDIHGGNVKGALVRLTKATDEVDEMRAEMGISDPDSSSDGAEELSGSWSLVTEADGAFIFRGAVGGNMRVQATGLDGTVAAVVVPWNGDEPTELLLVLEATGTITVQVDDPRLVDARVVIRTSDHRAHGWGGSPHPPEEAPAHPSGEVFDFAEGEGDMGVEDHSVVWGDDETEEEGEPRDSEIPEVDPEALEKAAMASFEKALLQWDPADEQGSMARAVEAILRDVPELQELFAAGFSSEIEGVAGLDAVELSVAIAGYMNRKEPTMGSALSFVAARFKTAPEVGLVAMVEDPVFSAELQTHIDEQKAVRRAAGGDEDEEFEDPEIVVAPSEEERAAETWMVGVDAEYAALRALWGPLGELLVRNGSASEEVASGRPGEAITVRTGYSYHVTLAIDAEHHELDCGAVAVGAGDALEWTCGRSEDSALLGRVVDLQGRPVAGAKVELQTMGDNDLLTQATSDAAGRFQMKVALLRPQEVRVEVTGVAPADDSESPGIGEIRRVSLIPGASRNLGDVRIFSSVQAEVLTDEFGGGPTFMEEDAGLVLYDVIEDHPLTALGVEPGDLLLRIGDEEATGLSRAAAMLRLRGSAAGHEAAPGGPSEVLFRRPTGETYRVAIPVLN